MKPGETILVTGAGGCIGSALTHRLAKSDAQHLILLDHSEHELYEIDLALAAADGGVPHIAIVGDICDAALLEEVSEEHRSDDGEKSACGNSQQCFWHTCSGSSRA
jgi:FlaA1/EpsC-like NDP-sugar epimerase